jgi:hypothetical protein
MRCLCPSLLFPYIVVPHLHAMHAHAAAVALEASVAAPPYDRAPRVALLKSPRGAAQTVALAQLRCLAMTLRTRVREQLLLSSWH